MSIQTNKDVVRRYRELYNADHLEDLAEVLAEDFTPHNRLEMPGLDLPAGLEGLRQIHHMTLAAFPDLHITTDQLIAEGDFVVELWTQTQTHTGVAVFGAPAHSGRSVMTSGASIYRLAGGKIVEHWAEMNFVAVLQQLGVLA